MISRMQPWMIYGANGYTGELIAREAVRRGHRPILAGRSAEKVEPLARELGCDARVVRPRPHRARRRRARPPLRRTVLHHQRADGRGLPRAPARTTSTSPARSRSSSRSSRATATRRRAASRCCRASASTSSRPTASRPCSPTTLPDATELLARLLREGERAEPRHDEDDDRSRSARGARSAATAASCACRSPTTSARSPSPCGARTAMTIPWGDVATAFRTTGIPNIRVYLAASPKAIARMRRMRSVLPLLSPKPIRRLLQRIAAPPRRTRRADARHRPRLPLGRGPRTGRSRAR